MTKEIVRTRDFIMNPNELTGMQDRLISAVQTKIKVNKDIEFVDFTLSEIGKIMKLKITNYERFRELFHAVKNIELAKDEGDRVTLSTLFSEITWDKRKGFIRFFFSKLAKENFIMVQGKVYASIEATIATFKSGHAVKIFQIVSLLKNRRSKRDTIDIDEFRRLLQITDKYSDMRNLRSRVLDPSVKEINKKTDLKIAYKLNKIGRYVKSITFEVLEYNKLRPITRLESNNTVEDSGKIVKICKKYKFTPEQTLEIIERYPSELFFKVNYEIMNKRGTKEAIRKPHGYFWSKYHEQVKSSADMEKEAAQQIRDLFSK